MSPEFKIPDKANVTFCGHDLGEVDMSVPEVSSDSIPACLSEGWAAAPKVIYDMIDAPEIRDAAGQRYKQYMGVSFYCALTPQKMDRSALKKMCDFLGFEYKERVIKS